MHHPNRIRDGILTKVWKLDYFGQWYEAWELRTPMEQQPKPKFSWPDNPAGGGSMMSESQWNREVGKIEKEEGRV